MSYLSFTKLTIISFIKCRCHDFYPEGHRCYVISKEIPQLIEEKEGNKVICFAFECTQDALVQCDKGFQPDIYEKCMHCLTSACGSYEHIPNFSVDQRVFTVFKDTSKCTRAIQYIMRLCSYFLLFTKYKDTSIMNIKSNHFCSRPPNMRQFH